MELCKSQQTMRYTYFIFMCVVQAEWFFLFFTVKSEVNRLQYHAEEAEVERVEDKLTLQGVAVMLLVPYLLLENEE